MARVKITEHTAKTILHNHLQIPYRGVSINAEKPLDAQIESLSAETLYVVKVDQGIKKRMKNGLVQLKVKREELKSTIQSLNQKGYSRFIIEEFLPYKPEMEKFLSLERTRKGMTLHYSNQGGIDIEENASSIKKSFLNEKTEKTIASELQLPVEFLQKLREVFERYYFSFLEINPLVVLSDENSRDLHILDLAAEVDSTAMFFVQGAWGESDIVHGKHAQKTPEELAVNELSHQSQAAFSLEVLNPNVSIFVLLSGGGASVTLADEVYNLGYGKQLANYGEYSGNPNAEETYLYTKQLLSLLLKSQVSPKVLIIGGGVANFTDVRITFNGVVQALEEVKDELRKQNIKVFVRRGGPHQEQGLATIKSFLEKEGLYGYVAGPELPLNEIVTKAIANISSN